jgi:NAD(P)-dependent dehydrogenase (short-subunit alcohol dehydrogenase family)
MKIKQSIVAITGAGGGLGSAMAKRLAASLFYLASRWLEQDWEG